MTRTRTFLVSMVTALVSALVLGVAQPRASACQKGESFDRAMEGAAVTIIGTPIDISFGTYRLYTMNKGEQPGAAASGAQVLLTAPQVLFGLSSMYGRDGIGSHPVVLGVTTLAGVLMFDGIVNLMTDSPSPAEQPLAPSGTGVSWTPTVMSDGQSAGLGVLGHF